ncbi:MAG: helix-turn-helix domain-containing protein [Acetatifactor sp.]|nr:helix-turn-helix domain-containing protein [Acetatifactor sp.]
MFDTNKVAENIRVARTKKNMTQMNLADEMGVSYQAVSNWERGNSMPDISKLPELCKILDIRFEELVGEKTEETEIAGRLMKEDEEVTLEEMSKVAQLVQPDKIEDKVTETVEKGNKISFSALVGLAPFMDKETLGKMAEEMATDHLGKLCAIAPFLSKKTLDRIIDNSMQKGKLNMSGVASIAPFLSKSSIQKIVEYLIAHGQTNKIAAIAPFMGKGMFTNHWADIEVDEETEECNSNNQNLEERDLDDMDEEEVAQIAIAALERGEDVEEFLDYMDEDDVAEMAFKALELGKDVECYLDYMDEDDIKELLLKATRK